MHPLAGDLSTMKDNEIEDKIKKLTKVYFQTSNGHLQQQIAMMLEEYQIEISSRRAQQLKDMYNSRNMDLDDIIDVN